ncbi:HAMP domain-containing histidine kinase [Hahella sp. KA22]|nr:HAMP domain-containing histidine kinase [Hahella sp. KA22]QAY57376.1 HAMP domain-containing histidine kinase [Hahella sp. KA22]
MSHRARIASLVVSCPQLWGLIVMNTTKYFAWLATPLQRDSLRYLAYYLVMQSISLVALLALFSGHWRLELPPRLPWAVMPAQLAITALTCLASVRIRELTTGRYLAVLLASTLLLGWFLHDTGGHTNPFISLLLMPVAMGAALLGWQSSLILAAVCVSIYFALTQDFVALTSSRPDGLQNFMRLHLAGMWLTFLLSVALLLIVVAPLTLAIRRQREQIAAQREQMLRDERLVATAIFAAGAAHKLGAPLGTLALLVDDLRHDVADAQAQEDLRSMATQIDLCKQTLSSMMRQAEDIRTGVVRSESLEGFVQRLREEFSLLHPAGALRLASIENPQAEVRSEEMLDMAILNLLDNAAKASAEDPVLEARLSDGELLLRIHDKGPGLPSLVRQNLGKSFVSMREGGNGLGLFLSHSTIERLGGSLSLLDVADGTITEILLPMPQGARCDGENATLSQGNPNGEYAAATNR